MVYGRMKEEEETKEEKGRKEWALANRHTTSSWVRTLKYAGTAERKVKVGKATSTLSYNFVVTSHCPSRGVVEGGRREGTGRAGVCWNRQQGSWTGGTML